MTPSAPGAPKPKQLRVLFATPECAPLIKTGGLADVSAALPAALIAAGVDCRILLPGYRQVLAQSPDCREIARFAPMADFPAARLLNGKTTTGVPLYLIDCPEMYDRPAGPYQDENGTDWPDNALRFGLLSRIAALLGSSASPLDWRPHVLHCNEWQTGLAPAYLRYAEAAGAATLLTVHNLGFQGIFEPGLVAALGLPADCFTPEGVEYYGKLSFLKAGLQLADAITTVSPSYAGEIQNEALGFGLHGLLSARRQRLHGILNGIDTGVWNPATDPLIARRYSAETLDAKQANKRALQQRLGLSTTTKLPLFAVVSRLTEQKGLDWLLQIAPHLVALPAQLALLGGGDGELERGFVTLAQRHPKSVSATIGFDESLAHLIEAGADAFLMPSRFEPCGMNQMYSQRYGTPPIVRATGGLADTVIDCTPDALADGSASGFVFHEPGAQALLAAIERAAGAWRDSATWHALQRNGMKRDFSWDASARRYGEIYTALTAERA
ncbi:MAG: glycogen synthase GlgA [Burkholderiales bacterium]|nr:glycogen synthase GlgA [Burkholderiales bacterium]